VGAFIVTLQRYPDQHIPRCRHIKTNGTQCGSPALRHKKYCYFHHRWRETRLDLNRAGALHLSTIVELPVLEDADSIQMAVMQVMRLILCRQLDHKAAGLLLYALQTASSNLRLTQFEPRHKPQVVIDPRSVTENGVGDDAWDPSDFAEENFPEEQSAEAQPESKHRLAATPLELKELNRVEAALEGAHRGNGRDLKTVLEFAGIFPPQDSPSTIDP
jgi:hypothetical protein